MTWEIKPIKNGYMLSIPKSNKRQETYFEETYFKEFSEAWDEVGKRIIDDNRDRSNVIKISTLLL
jgi:hypothetical protein